MVILLYKIFNNNQLEQLLSIITNKRFRCSAALLDLAERSGPDTPILKMWGKIPNLKVSPLKGGFQGYYYP